MKVVANPDDRRGISRRKCQTTKVVQIRAARLLHQDMLAGGYRLTGHGGHLIGFRVNENRVDIWIATDISFGQRFGTYLSAKGLQNDRVVIVCACYLRTLMVLYAAVASRGMGVGYSVERDSCRSALLGQEYSPLATLFAGIVAGN
jgi:hypothetical protein